MKHPKTWNQPALVISIVLVMVVCCLLPQSVFADEIQTTDGSRIVGEVLRHDTAVLKIKTSFAGTIEIQWKDIVKVTLTEPGTVLMRDGETMEIEALSHEGDQFVLYPVSSGDPVIVASSQVKTFEAEAWELGQGRKRTGRINLAVENETGNSEKREYDLDAELHSRWGKNHLMLLGQLEYDTTRGVTSTDNWTVFANFDHTFSGKWYLSAALLLRQDRFKDLKLRSAIGPALGYRFFESRPLSLRTELGIYYLEDDFYDQSDETFWGPGWYFHYEHKVWKQRLQLYHRHFTFAAVNTSGKYFWRSWSGVRAPLLSGIVAGIEYEIDYDSEPAVRTEKTDTTFKIKLGYEWK